MIDKMKKVKGEKNDQKYLKRAIFTELHGKFL